MVVVLRTNTNLAVPTEQNERIIDEMRAMHTCKFGTHVQILFYVRTTVCITFCRLLYGLTCNDHRGTNVTSNFLHAISRKPRSGGEIIHKNDSFILFLHETDNVDTTRLMDYENTPRHFRALNYLKIFIKRTTQVLNAISLDNPKIAFYFHFQKKKKKNRSNYGLEY